MNKLTRLLVFLVVIAMLVGCLASCEIVDSLLGNNPTTDNTDNNEPGNNDDNNGGNDVGEIPDNKDETDDTTDDTTNKEDNKEEPKDDFVDYASQVKFDPNSGRAYAYVKVHSYVDGDTTHFETTDGTVIGTLDYVKARYLAINTPESTGVIEPWGKKASNYTRTQLEKATSIIIESDSDTWNYDSTGSRYLLWVWYKTAEDTDYRNLNLEILQQGLAFGSNVSSNVYGEVAFTILTQSTNLKLHVFNKAVKDPDYYYGGAVELSLMEIKANCEKYEGMLVKFEAVVAKQVDSTIYVEEYDPVNDMYFGMQIYAGYNFPNMHIFAIGNRLSIVGTLQYYEAGGTYQISNLKYKTIDPDWDGGCRVIGTGYSSSYQVTSVDDIMNGSITLETYENVLDDNGEIIDEILVNKEFDYGELAHYSTVTVNNLTVQSVWTTNNGGNNDGALTITCVSEEGITIKVRTASKLTKTVNGEKVDVVAADFPKGSVISIKGIIDSYNGSYQLGVFSFSDITFN